MVFIPDPQKDGTSMYMAIWHSGRDNFVKRDEPCIVSSSR